MHYSVRDSSVNPAAQRGIAAKSPGGNVVVELQYSQARRHNLFAGDDYV